MISDIDKKYGIISMLKSIGATGLTLKKTFILSYLGKFINNKLINFTILKARNCYFQKKILDNYKNNTDFKNVEKNKQFP